MYEDLTVAELDALVAAGRISLDDYWQARIALDLRLEQEEHANRFNLAARNTDEASAADPLPAAGASPDLPTPDDDAILRSLRGDLTETRRDAASDFRYRSPRDSAPGWIDPPPMPRPPRPDQPPPPPLVTPPPGRSPFSDPHGSSWVRLPISGPSADAAPTRANDGRGGGRWWRRRRR
ncbi:hypothetical protein SAMN05444157_3356 [Frankineae bacterium MT45]|nr:hypothetical protein SAMN05444157_3356 [Frankineae bacterium MT45]